MAQERNQVGASGSTETDEIRGEIERTRVEMSETIGEIQDRLRPDHLLQQAKDSVREAAAGKVRNIMSSAGDKAATAAIRARGAGEYLTDYAKVHPFRIAVTIGAVAAFYLIRRTQTNEWSGASDPGSWNDSDSVSYDDGRSLRHRVGAYASSAREVVGEYASTARERAGEYASSARGKAGEYAVKAGELASTAGVTAAEYAQSARENARYAAERARSAAGTATSSVDDFVTENPLAAGAIALAIGAAIGLAMPGTEMENRAMGETRDLAWERARQAVAGIKDNVARKVEDAAENFVGDSLKGIVHGSATEPMGRA